MSFLLTGIDAASKPSVYTSRINAKTVMMKLRLNILITLLLLLWIHPLQFRAQELTLDEKENKVEFPHERIHSIFKRIYAVNLGNNVFFVKQFLDGDPQKVYRLRIYQLVKNIKENAVELRIYSIKTPEKYSNADLNPNLLNNLNKNEIKLISGCEVFWRLVKDKSKFIGATKQNACRIFSSRLNKFIYINDNLVLTSNEIWINDQATDESGNYVFGNKSGEPSKLKKVNFYTGWAAFLKDGSINILGEDPPAESWTGIKDIKIHDQGDMMKINDKFSIQLANVMHRSGLWVLKLGIVDNNTGKTITYVWTNPGSERIGLNLRWFQVGLTKLK
ncbi:MAG TPA: chromophore lyase CpcT/CpeT [Candidatus Nitrosotenuis sp.]|nr:chromophore lyase CpcT/CpeT [Candidatus Nitrosotenuis sp.]